MINVLQKVTTFPLEMIEFPDIGNLTDNDFKNIKIHEYYTNPKQTLDANGIVPVNQNGPINDETIKYLKRYENDLNNDQLKKYKKKFIVYNAIYEKLFANNLNLLEKTTETTVVVFPTMNQSDKGSVELNINPNANKYYYEKFKNIKSNTNKDIFVSDEKPIYYIELVVFNNEKKEEYTQTIKSQLNEIKKNILDYNKITTKQRELNPINQKAKPVQNLLFIMDSDKKGLFTGFYKKQLSKEKQDILNKEYSTFLNSSDFNVKKVIDNGINLTISEVVKESKLFTSLNGIKIGTSILSNEQFESFIIKVKEAYKKTIDKEYKKSLELNDNVKKLKIFYKIDNADKVLEDKIQTGSNKLYQIYQGNGKEKDVMIVGYFLLVSEERGIYRFKEDVSKYKLSSLYVGIDLLFSNINFRI